MRTFWAGFGLVGLVVLAATAPTHARSVSHFAEDFASPRAYWPFRVLAGTGSAHVMAPQALLRIDAGMSPNDWTAVESARTYDTSWGTRHILDVRARVRRLPMNPADQTFWGFHHSFGSQEFSVGFWVRFFPGSVQVEARTRNGTLSQSFIVPGVDPLELHDYRVEVVESTAQFFVNDVLVWEHSGWEVPQALLRVRMAKASAGRPSGLDVDAVSLREIVTPQTQLLSIDVRDDLREAGPRVPADWPPVSVDAEAAGLERPGDDAAADEPGVERSALREQSWSEIKSAWR